MKQTMKKLTAVALSCVLLLSMLLTFAACNEEAGSSADVTEAPTQVASIADTEEKPTEEATSSKVEKMGIWADSLYNEDTTLGEGAKTVSVTVEAEGSQVVFTVKTDAETLGEALLALSLIEGENSQYGLYIKRVNGMLADYDVDQTYWGFYQNGEYMMTGVDSTPINGGEHFELVRTK